MDIKCIKNYEFPEGVIEFGEGLWYKIDLTDCKEVGYSIYFPIENEDGDQTYFNKDCAFFNFDVIKR